MYRKIFLGLFLLMGFQLAQSQDTLSGNYGSLILAKKNYVINEVISVSDSFVVEAGAQIGVDLERDRQRFTVTESGIVVVGKGAIVKA